MVEQITTSSGKRYLKDETGLWYLEGYKELPEDEKAKICNGIGAADGLSKHFPSTIWFLDCSETGNRHDYSYHVGGTLQDRRLADKFFLINLYTQISKGTKLLKWIRRARARKYWMALAVFGGNHFNYTNASLDYTYSESEAEDMAQAAEEHVDAEEKKN